MSPYEKINTEDKKTKRRFVTNITIYAIFIFTVALTVRTLHISFQIKDPILFLPVVDSQAYINSAHTFIENGWMPQEVFFQDPLYSYFLALILTLSGDNHFSVVLIQGLIGSFTCLLIFLMSKRIFPFSVAVASGLIAALYPPLILYDGAILKTSLVVFLLVAFLSISIKSLDQLKPVAALSMGFTLGLSILLRGNLILFAPFAIIWLIHLQYKRGTNLFSIIFLCLLFISGISLPILPVTLSNYNNSGEFILLSAHGGQNFFLGNNPESDGAARRPRNLRANPKYEQEDFKRWAERETGKKLSHKEQSKFWFKKGLTFITEQPFESLKLQWKKTRLFLYRSEIWDNIDFQAAKTSSPILRNPFLHFGIIFPLGFVGLLAALKEFHKTEKAAGIYLLTLFSVVYSLSVIFFHVYARYRLPIIVILIPCSMFTVWWWRKCIYYKQFKTVVLSIIPLILAVIVSFYPVEVGREGQGLYNLGTKYLRTGNYEKAVEFLRQAVLADPENYLGWNNLGSCYYHIGDADAALGSFKQAISIRVDFEEALNNIGTIYAGQGRYIEAIVYFDRAIAIKPNYLKAWINKAKVHLLTGHDAKALESYERAHQIDPHNPILLREIALLCEGEDSNKALMLLEEALIYAKRLKSDINLIRNIENDVERLKLTQERK